MTLTLTFRMDQIERPYATFCASNSNVCPIFAIYEIFTYALPNVLDSIFLPYEVKVKNLDDLAEDWQANLFWSRGCVHKLALLGPTILFPMTFRDVRTYWRTDGHAKWLIAWHRSVPWKRSQKRFRFIPNHQKDPICNFSHSNGQSVILAIVTANL